MQTAILNDREAWRAVRNDIFAMIRLVKSDNGLMVVNGQLYRVTDPEVDDTKWVGSIVPDIPHVGASVLCKESYYNLHCTEGHKTIYKADYYPWDYIPDLNRYPDDIRWRGPKVMAKGDARIYATVTDVQVKPLQDMSTYAYRIAGLYVESDFTNNMNEDNVRAAWNRRMKASDKPMYSYDSNPEVVMVTLKRSTSKRGR